MMNIKKIFSLKIQPQINVEYKYDSNLEGLRGFCALGVLFAHGLGSNNLDETWKPLGIFPYLSVGALAVFLFFMLSGYVIGLNQKHYSTTSFYKKRIVRLYPIYIFSFLLYFLLIGKNFNLFQVIGNLLMLQNSRPYISINIPVIYELAPIWSINYEFIFYLIFPLVLSKKPNFVLTIILLLTIAIIGYYNNKYIPMILTDYSAGYLFWLGGLIISWFLPQINNKNFVNFLSYAFLILSYHHFAIGSIILKILNLFSKLDHGIGLEALFYLPLCILVVADLSMRHLPYRKVLKFLIYIPPLIIILYLIFTRRMFEDIRWIACSSFYLISILLYNEHKYSSIILNKLSYLGSISYALYVIHWPIMFLIRNIIPYSGTEQAYIIKFIIWILVTFGLSHILEKIIQPRIKKYFIKDGR